MNRSGNEPYHVISLFDWTGGIRDKRQNPLVYPENALMSGENVDLVNGGLKTRRGFGVALLSPHRELATVHFSPPTPVDEPLYGHSAIYDPVGRKVIVFGGVVGGDFDRAVRELDIATGTWETIFDNPPACPASRAYHTAVYDSANRAMWIFGGSNGATELDDLWRYDIASRVWQQVLPSGTGASGRFKHAALYDPVEGAMYVFGGRTGTVYEEGGAGTYYNDLWKYTVATNTGTILDPGGAPPGARYGHSATYNPDNRTIVTFGGYLDAAGSAVADLWNYDIASNTWSQVRSAAGGSLPHPEPILGHTALMFQSLGKILFLGGYGGDEYGPSVQTAWLYDAVADRFIEEVHDGFPDNFLCYHAAAYDSDCQGVVVVGGLTGGGPVYDCWGFGYGGPCQYTAPGPPVGEFRTLDQVRFPTNETSYLVAQIAVQGTNRLYASNDCLPTVSGSGTFRIIHELGPAAGVCSTAVLNDRLVITEGVATPPLVFAGSMDASGADWAVPKAVLVSYDDGGSWHDITPDVCDKDPDTYGVVGELAPNSGWLGICVDMSGVSGFSFEMDAGNTLSGAMYVEGHQGTWMSGSGWTDMTWGLNSTGTVIHTGGVFVADYHVENGVPGYWFRLRWQSGTSNVKVRRILFQAPCQHLQVIGEGQPDIPLGFLYWDQSESSCKDFTVEVSDDTYPTFARLNDGSLENPAGMGSADCLYIGYLTRFNAVELTPHNDYQNQASGVMSGSYWNGSGWAGLSGFVDATEEPDGYTLGKKGRIMWNTPSDWKENRPVSPQYPHGYWVKLRVSSNLTPKTYISEAKIWPVLSPLKKHRFALTVRDRMVLCNRTDAADQIDISRGLEEYGFAGTDSASLRIGGQGEIVAAVEAFNQGFIAKTDDWYLLNGYSPQTFSVERAEAAGQAPINNRVVVRAPHMEADLKNLMGLYYLNQAGAWYFAGLKVYQISQDVSWWDPAATVPRLDLNNLYKACGIYWPERNWVIWSVPMIVEGDAQTTNNHLIVYDLTLKAWLPPFTISLASLATAYHHNENAPGKLGQMGLYGGTYTGEVVRLFGPDDTTDRGQPIRAYAETGWLHFGSPEYVKLLRILTLYGKTAGGRITVEVFSDGDQSSPIVLNFEDLSMLGSKLFAQEQESNNIAGRFFKFRISFTDVTDVYGLQVGASIVREWGKL